ncbi:hypothetical protein HDR69_06690 [bacterium]|nr:hypothetical protein [Bacteroidales bacterium]MBD5386095.1 hypothetical protein [bacterium]
MKKFYAFAAAAAIAISANAQALYMTGASDNGPEEGGLPAQWAPSNPAEFEIVNGVYQITVNGLSQFKVSTAKSEVEGDWTDFNAGALTCNYGEEAGATVALTEGDANIMCPWTGDWTVVVAADLSTITMTTDTPKPTGGPELYLRGDMNSWDNIEGWMFEQVSDNVFKFVCGEDQKIQASETFKVADASWAKYNFGAGEEAEILLDLETEIFQGSNTNMTVGEEWNGVAWLCLDYEGAVMFVLSNDKEYVPEFLDSNAVETVAVENAPVYYYNLQGVRVENPVNGIYVKVVGEKAAKVLFNN